MKNKTSLAVYTISHLVIDFSCFYILMGTFSESLEDLMVISFGFLTYNIFAFGLQMFIGHFVDQHAIEHLNVALVGCFLVCLGVIFGVTFGFFSFNLAPWLALILCAFGNASFHIGGGIDSLVYSDGKMARGGIFVSSGAIGVTLGTVAGRSGFPAWIVITILLICLGAIYFFCSSENTKITPELELINISNPKISKRSIIIYLCIISIIVRSFVGFQIPITWKTNTFLFILPSICAFTGKMAGGLLADRFGARNVGVSSLLIAIPFLCFFFDNILLCALGLFAFNITMSITLLGVAIQLPNRPGFSFGLTTLALLVGNIPTFFFILSEKLISIVLPILIIISAICIFLAIENKKGGGYNDKEIHKKPKELSL
jgi:MFS transporter, FSR family, fosmidomycin resistance protein